MGQTGTRQGLPRDEEHTRIESWHRGYSEVHAQNINSKFTVFTRLLPKSCISNFNNSGIHSTGPAAAGRAQPAPLRTDSGLRRGDRNSRRDAILRPCDVTGGRLACRYGPVLSGMLGAECSPPGFESFLSRSSLCSEGGIRAARPSFSFSLSASHDIVQDVCCKT